MIAHVCIYPYTATFVKGFLMEDAVFLTYFAGININCMHQLGCLKGSSVQVGSRALEALNAAVLEVITKAEFLHVRPPSA